VSGAQRVSLVLPNKNNAPVLDLFFETLLRHTSYPDLEMVVVDDGSTDSSVAVLRRWRDSGRFPRFELLETEGGGICRALNLAIENATGEVIVRLDGDATLETPGWLDRMLDFRALHPKVGVVATKVVFDSGRLQALGMNVVGPGGVHPRGSILLEEPGRRTMDIAVEYPYEADAPGRNEAAEVDAAIGCCMLFERSLWERVGGFDLGWSPVAFEDFDFALEARRLGLKVFVLPEISVVHRISLRHPRERTSRPIMALFALRRTVGRFVPQRLREAVAARARLGDHDPARLELLRRHCAYWQEKWGWDPINPRMEDVLARYGGTEVCWAYDDALRREGQEILRAWAAQVPTTPLSNTPRRPNRA
jgi:GT2 family glycosyltransferase